IFHLPLFERLKVLHPGSWIPSRSDSVGQKMLRPLKMPFHMEMQIRKAWQQCLASTIDVPGIRGNRKASRRAHLYDTIMANEDLGIHQRWISGPVNQPVSLNHC